MKLIFAVLFFVLFHRTTRNFLLRKGARNPFVHVAFPIELLYDDRRPVTKIALIIMKFDLIRNFPMYSLLYSQHPSHKTVRYLSSNAFAALPLRMSFLPTIFC